MDASQKEIAKACAAYIAAADRAGFDAYEAEYRASPDATQDGIDQITSCRALLDLEVLAADAKLDDRYRPKMWWMRGPYPGNFGDILTPYVLWHAFGVAPRWTPALRADGLAIGSIAKMAQPGMKIWGTGMPRATDPLEKDAVWTAVRGPLSRDAVLAAGGECPEIYGDAAVLLPEIYNPEVEKTDDVGIIPHVLQDATIRANLDRCGDASGVKVISLFAGTFDQIEAVIREIKSCREIVTTSLHGLIVAHAYGIPAQSARLVRSGKAEDSFKMRDYKASIGLSDAALAIPEAFDDLAWLKARQCVIAPKPIDTDALKAAFPFPVRKG